MPSRVVGALSRPLTSAMAKGVVSGASHSARSSAGAPSRGRCLQSLAHAEPSASVHASMGSPASRRSRIHRAIICAAPVSLPAKYAVYFKPGRRLRERVNSDDYRLSELETQRRARDSQDLLVRSGR